MAKYITQAKLAILETNGIHLVDSNKFSTVKYKPDKRGINIYAGACGELQVDWKNLDDLIDELKEFREVYG